MRTNLIQTCLLAAALALPAVTQAQFLHTTTNGAVTITGYTGPGGAVIIPSAINGLPVTSIGNSAFWVNEKVTSVTIPNSVTSIGNFAFGLCTGMTNAILGNNITNIGADAFGSTGLTSLSLPDNLKVVGSGAFFNCKGLTSVVIPNSVTSLGPGAFEECHALTNVDMGDSVTNIEILAFDRCYALANVKIGRGVTVIAGGAFGECSNLTSIVIPDNVKDIQVLDNEGGVVGAFAGCSGLTNVTIGQGVTNIGSYAFAGCASLRTIAIPDNVTNIGSGAFSFCSVLTNFMVPKSVLSIGYGAFNDCLSMTAITVDTNNPVYSSVNGVLFDKSQTTLIEYPRGRNGGYIIPDSVTCIGVGAFAACHGLASVTIPNSVVNIIDGEVLNGEAGAFSGCTSLTNVAIGNSVTNIGGYSFAGCASLRTIAIPASVTSIGVQTFAYCTSLTNINVALLNSAYSSLDGVLFDKSQTTLIQFPGGKAGGYQIPNSVTSIFFEAFANCAHLTSITIGGGVTNFGYGAFERCASLKGVYFPGNAPSDSPDLGSCLNYDTKAIVYYLPGTTGWSSTFAGRPTALWLPEARAGDASFGVRTNQFGFSINWASGQTVVVEACTNLANPVWTPLATNTLTSDSFYFSDPQWTNYPARFYRLHSP